MSLGSRKESTPGPLHNQETGSNPTTTNTSTTSTGPKPPDGGVRAWLVVSGGFGALVCTFGYLNSFGYSHRSLIPAALLECELKQV